MGSPPSSRLVILSFLFFALFALNQCSGTTETDAMVALLHVYASTASAKKIPDNLFGLFFEVNQLD